ncbi:MAG: alanine racemase [Pseudomonadota bacterium]
MTRPPNSVTIDLPALVHNLHQVRKIIGPDIKIMGVVKSDAYGHGLVMVSQTLEKHGADCLGVAYLHEAITLRKNGIRKPVLILGGIRSREDAEAVFAHNLTPVLFDLSSAEILAQECDRRKGRKIHVQIKVDTGMGRLGIPFMDAGPVMERLKIFKGIFIEALTSHLSSADDLNRDFTETQIANFQRAVDAGRKMGLELPLNNLANSAGIMAHRRAHFDMVRPGIMLYGGLPSPDFKTDAPLSPVMGFRGRIVQIRNLPDHTPVSYGRMYTTEGVRKIAVLSVGYGDGLPRCLSNRGKVLMGTRKVNIVGRVCMNMTMADITGTEDLEPGREVVFLGGKEGAAITGEDIARWGDTISYEIFCSIGRANPREYIL